MSTCFRCGHVLSTDEIAIYRRMVNRGADAFLCIPCLAEHFHVPASLIFEKIEHFRAMGCTLFPPTETSAVPSFSTNSQSDVSTHDASSVSH